MKLPNIETTALYLLILGGLNAGVAAVFDYNVIAKVLGSGSTVTTVLYALMGLAAVWLIADRMGFVSSDDA